MLKTHIIVTDKAHNRYSTYRTICGRRDAILQERREDDAENILEVYKRGLDNYCELCLMYYGKVWKNQDMTLYDFDVNDLGEIFPHVKKILPGSIIFVHGVSEATVDNGGFDQVARSLLWNFPCEPGATESDTRHWGLLMAENSLPIKNTLTKMERGEVPFAARILLKDKISAKGQSYWLLERVKVRFDAQGKAIVSKEDLPPIQFDDNGNPMFDNDGEPVAAKK